MVWDVTSRVGRRTKKRAGDLKSGAKQLELFHDAAIAQKCRNQRDPDLAD
jgi:hypothetical protein